MVINKVLQPCSNLSNIGNLVDEVKGLMKNFRWFRVQHTKRETNAAAHLLAKSALTLEEDLYWVDESQVMLIPVIASDCNLTFY